MEITQISINRRINMQWWYIHKMEYYSVLKRNKLLIYTTTWVNLTNTMSSEISQTWKRHTVQFHICDVPEQAKSISDEENHQLVAWKGGRKFTTHGNLLEWCKYFISHFGWWLHECKQLSKLGKPSTYNLSILLYENYTLVKT